MAVHLYLQHSPVFEAAGCFPLPSGQLHTLAHRLLAAVLFPQPGWVLTFLAETTCTPPLFCSSELPRPSRAIKTLQPDAGWSLRPSPRGGTCSYSSLVTTLCQRNASLPPGVFPPLLVSCSLCSNTGCLPLPRVSPTLSAVPGLHQTASCAPRWAPPAMHTRMRGACSFPVSSQDYKFLEELDFSFCLSFVFPECSWPLNESSLMGYPRQEAGVSLHLSPLPMEQLPASRGALADSPASLSLLTARHLLRVTESHFKPT